jgi:hypothetical protein
VKIGLAGAIVVAVGRMAAMGRLPRNVLVGIRIPSTMRSDEAWRAGHLAAASALTAAGAGPVVAAVAVAVKRPGQQTQTLFSRVATAWLLAWVGVAIVQARRAARATETRP